MKYQNRTTRLLFSFVLCFMFTFTACEEDSDTTPTVSENIVEVAQLDSRFTNLVAALTQANLVSVLEGPGPFTVLAPTNEAFETFLSDNGFASLEEVPADVLSSVLLNHVVSGRALSTDLNNGYLSTSTQESSSNNPLSLYVNITSGVRFNDVASVSQADIESSNGVIHAINAVIGLPTVVTHALANPNFSSLVAALTREDLSTNYVDILSGTGPFTVFAPTNEAFQALLDSNPDWSSLADIPTATLEAVLNYHVVQGANVLSTELSDGQAITTLQGDASLVVSLSGGPSLRDGQDRITNIIATDVQGINGIIHAIDGVLLP